MKRLGIYQRLKISYAYDLYWGIADPAVLASRSREVAFYRDLLPDLKRGSVVIDIGANVGEKADIFLRLGAKVVAVEPDTANQLILRQRFCQWRLNKKPVIVVGKAVSDREGSSTFYVNGSNPALSTLNQKWVTVLGKDELRFGTAMTFSDQRVVETTTLDKLVDEFGSPSFVKIDVEGWEPEVLRGLNSPVRCLSFEVNLPEFAAEGRQCIDRLSEIDSDGTFNFAASCQEGLLLPEWLRAPEFLSAFDQCRQRSLEVFWRSLRAA